MDRQLRNALAIATLAGGLAAVTASGCGSGSEEVGNGGDGAAGLGGGEGATAPGGGGSAGEGGQGQGGGTGGEGAATGGGGQGGSAQGGNGATACTDCHGSTENAAPPQDTSGGVDVSLPGVGAHQSHLAVSSWHRQVECEQCHIVPTELEIDPAVPTHLNDVNDIVWGSIAQQGSYDTSTLTCSNTYCHGGNMPADKDGATSNRTPVWTTVDGTQAACGTSCHTLPPGGFTHPEWDACEMCHGQVISSFDAANPANSTWADASLHIDGVVQVGDFTCTSCHGDPVTTAINPPFGTAGETLTTEAAVGAHEAHLAKGTGWHRDVRCVDCHELFANVFHADGVTDFAFSAVASAEGASPIYDEGSNTCSDAYCHGTTLVDAKAGGVVSRTPDWTVVNGTYDACGTTCHTNPPGEWHPQSESCGGCHAEVVAAYDAGNPAATTWNDPTLHINGVVESSGTYHDLAAWVSPIDNPNHHGSHYFLTNQQRDEHDVPCSSCHGANYDGGWSGVSCNNTSCHGGEDWKSCDFCHGTPPAQYNPPVGVGGELTIASLAVGRHQAHLTASSSHVAFACSDCHVVPVAGDVSHASDYAPSADLTTIGHHGDVTFSGPATGMVWDVTATAGAPVNRRGTCVQACHSDGNGGPPNVTPYWAGGTWVSSCNSCHDDPPDNGEHDKHVNGENLDCTVCHDPASSPTHLNGQSDVKTTITGPGGGGVTSSTNGNCGAGNVTCTGTCHGEGHNECWF